MFQFHLEQQALSFSLVIVVPLARSLVSMPRSCLVAAKSQLDRRRLSCSREQIGLQDNLSASQSHVARRHHECEPLKWSIYPSPLESRHFELRTDYHSLQLLSLASLWFVSNPITQLKHPSIAASLLLLCHSQPHLNHLRWRSFGRLQEPLARVE